MSISPSLAPVLAESDGIDRCCRPLLINTFAPWRLCESHPSLQQALPCPSHGGPVHRTVQPCPRRALTLAELVVVLAILTIVSAIVLPMAARHVVDSRGVVTRQNLTRLRDAIAQTYWQDNGRQLPRPGAAGLTAERTNHPQLRYLFFNPRTNPEDASVDFDPAYRLGWRGPYLVGSNDASYTINPMAGFTDQYGENGDPTVLDGWGNPIVIQNPGLLLDGRQDVRLVSAGPDGILTTAPLTFTDALTSAATGDDIIVSFQVR